MALLRWGIEEDGKSALDFMGENQIYQFLALVIYCQIQKYQIKSIKGIFKWVESIYTNRGLHIMQWRKYGI